MSNSAARRIVRRLTLAPLLAALSALAAAPQDTPAGPGQPDFAKRMGLFSSGSPAPLDAPADPARLDFHKALGLHAPGLKQFDDVVVLSPGSAWYPDSEAATGAQGLAIVVMDLTPDGHVAKANMVRSTHAPALDDQAVRLASQLRWMGARRMPPQASLQVLFSRDDGRSAPAKSCADLDVDVAWLQAHDPAQPPETVSALRAIRGLVMLNTTWMPDRIDREAGQPARDAVFVASRRTIAECAAHPDRSLKDVFNPLLHQAALAHENAPALPVPATDAGALPRSILYTSRDVPASAGRVFVLGNDPAYPPAALAAGQQGELEVQADLREDGTIERTVVNRNQFGSGVLAAGAEQVLRRWLADVHRARKDPDTFPPAVVMEVVFKRQETDTIASLDCATYRIDAADWKGDLLQLPDFQSLTSLLTMRAFDPDTPDARLPHRDMTRFKDRDRREQVKALDAACLAAPDKRAIDALIDAIDALP